VSVMCPVCGLEFEVSEGKGEGDTVVCPWCHAELVPAREGGDQVTSPGSATWRSKWQGGIDSGEDDGG
jgi:Zn-finger nucleic acid-binding protein